MAHGQLAGEYLAVADMALAGSKAHGRPQRRHFIADRTIAHPSSRAAPAVFVAPDRVAGPAALPELADLYVSDIAVELRADVRSP